MTPKEHKKILIKIEEAYEQSEIKKYAEKHDKKWHYAVSSKLVPGNILLVGFNWGVEKDCPHSPNKDYPIRTFEVDYFEKKLGSFSRVYDYMKNKSYFTKEQLSKAGQTNFCFFRSKEDNQVKNIDLDLCFPIFMELVEYAKPSKILLFSSRVRDYFDKNHSIENTNREFICYKNEKRNIRYLVFKGELVVNSSRYPIFSLPHPNYQLRKELRDKAWKFCFK